MSFLCHFFNHKRSSSLASYDHVHHCWVSQCKRCYAVLVREAPGEWREPLFDAPGAACAQPASLQGVHFTILPGGSAHASMTKH